MEEFYTINMKTAFYEYLKNGIRIEQSSDNSFNRKLFVSPRHQLSLQSFISELFLQMQCSLEVYILSLVYIKRIMMISPHIFNNETAYNIVMISIMLAHKFCDEACYKSDFYAYLSGLTIAQLNAMEVDFLYLLDYSLFVSAREYSEQYNTLVLFVSSHHKEEVFLPDLFWCTNAKGVKSLHYRNYPQDCVRKQQYEMWKSRCGSSIHPMIAVPVFITVPPIHTLLNSYSSYTVVQSPQSKSFKRFYSNDWNTATCSVGDCCIPQSDRTSSGELLCNSISSSPSKTPTYCSWCCPMYPSVIPCYPMTNGFSVPVCAFPYSQPIGPFFPRTVPIMMPMAGCVQGMRRN